VFDSERSSDSKSLFGNEIRLGSESLSISASSIRENFRIYHEVFKVQLEHVLGLIRLLQAKMPPFCTTTQISNSN
jgi:hypothetical protein